MRFYEMTWDDSDPREHYRFYATHRSALPGVKCGTCGWTGAVCYAIYASVRLPGSVDPKPYNTYWPVPPAEVQKLLEPLLPIIPAGLPVGAGMKFGALSGKCQGTPDDIAWVDSRTPLISHSAISKLERLGIQDIPLAKTEISFRSGKSFNYWELDVEPRAELDKASVPEGGWAKCPSCGILKMHQMRSGWEDNPVVSMASMPPDRDLVRIRELEGTIIVTERFATAVQRAELSGVHFCDICLK